MLREYQEKFPEVFEYLSTGHNAGNDLFHEMDVFYEGDASERLKELQVHNTNAANIVYHNVNIIHIRRIYEKWVQESDF